VVAHADGHQGHRKMSLKNERINCTSYKHIVPVSVIEVTW
jgi:hypothetical protein